MKEFLKSRIFIGVFLLIYSMFFVLTMLIFDFKTKSVGSHNDYGVPFSYYQESCFGSGYAWDGLLGNIFFALILSFAGSLIFRFFRSQMIIKKLR